MCTSITSLDKTKSITVMVALPICNLLLHLSKEPILPRY